MIRDVIPTVRQQDALTRLKFRHALALIPIVIFVLGSANIVPALASSNGLFVLSICLLSYVLAQNLAGRTENGMWAGYISLYVNTAWLTLGLEAALLIIVIGAGLVILIQGQRRWQPGNRPEQPELLPEALARMSIAGSGVIVANGVFMLLGESTPVTSLDIELFIKMIIAAMMGYLAILSVGLLFTDGTLRNLRDRVSEGASSEALLIAVTVSIPAILDQVGMISFVTILGLSVAQAIRYNQIGQARRALLKRVKEMDTLNSLGNAISTNLLLDHVLEAIYREVKQLIVATTFFIALYDDTEDTIHYPLVITDGKPRQWARRKIARGMTDTVIRSGQPLLITLEQTGRFRQLGIAIEEVESASFLGVPLLVMNRVVGVMGAMHSSDRQAFNQVDVDVMQTIANQASLAVRNATLYERTVTLAQNLSLINEHLQDIMLNMDRDEAMVAACSIAIQVTGAQKAAVCLLDMSEENQLRVVQSIGFDPTISPDDLSRPYQPEQYANGPRIITDVSDQKDDLLRLHGELGGFRAMLEVPLRSGSTIIGNIVVYHDAPHFHETPEINLLEMLANQITTALDNAELLQALELYASEQAQLVHLSRISGSNLDLDRVINDVSEMLCQMLNIDSIEIGLFTPDMTRISFYAPTEGLERPIHYEMALNAVPEIAHIPHETMLTPNVFHRSREEGSAAMKNFMQERGDQTLAIVPMFINQEVTGLILMHSSEHHPFRDNDRRLIEMATHQIAAQIHNARIHTLTEEALVQRLEQLSLIEDIAQQISQSQNLDLIIRNVLEAAIQSTQADLAALALLDTDANCFKLIIREIIADQTHERIEYISLNEGIIGQIAQSGERLIIGDNINYPSYIPTSREQAYRSTLAVPLSKGNTVIGVLNIESVEPNFFTTEQAGFVKSLAGHAAISIDKWHLLEERQQQIQTLTLLRSLTIEATTTVGQGPVMNAILKTSLRILNGFEGAIYHYAAAKSDDHADEIVYIYGISDGKRSLEHSDLYVPSQLIYEAGRSKQVQIVEDVRQDALYAGFEDLEHVRHRAVLAIPIIRRGTASEILVVNFREVRHFTEADHSTVDLMTTQIAGHIENANLYEAIRNNNDQVRAILDANRDGIILLDYRGYLLDANLSAAQFLGIDLNEHINKNFALILSEHSRIEGDDDNVNEELLTMARIYRLDPQRITHREYTLNGRTKPIRIKETSSPVRDADGRTIGRLLSLRDVTEEYELAEYRQKIQSMVIHDLRGPLSSIISSLYLAQDIVENSDSYPIEEILPQAMDVSLESANNLLELVETLSIIPRLEKRELPIEPQLSSVQELADKAYNALAASLKEANLNIRYEIAPDANEINVDLDLMRRVFGNLLHNAFKFTPAQGTIMITADRSASPATYIRVRVCDTGPGIPDEMRDRIFGEYEQIEGRKPQQGGKGSGLGLHFCKLAVEAHGGRIWVEAEGPLSGACFTMTLPAPPVAKT